MTPLRSEPGPVTRLAEKMTSSAVKSCAFVELDAFAQMKAPVQRIESFPAGRQARFELHVRAAAHEALVDGAVDAEAEALVDLIGIDGLELALEGELKRLGVHRGRQRRTQKRGGQSDDRQHARFRFQRRHSRSPWLFGAANRVAPTARQVRAHAHLSPPKSIGPAGIVARTRALRANTNVNARERRNDAARIEKARRAIDGGRQDVL